MELVERFDKKRMPLNKVTGRYTEIPNEYSQVVHAWIRNDKGEFLIQKRSMKKKFFPGQWSVTGGGADVGETTLDALYRECKEEIGINLIPENVELMMTVKRKNAFIDIYLAKQSFDIKDVKMQKDEVDDVKWATINDIRNLIKNEEMGTSVVMYFDTLCNLIDYIEK